MGNKKNFNVLKSKRGQSTVEYILLLVVVLSFISAVFNSAAFQQFFAEDSAFFNAIASRISVNYRHATNIPAAVDIGAEPTPNHPSFVNPTGSETRFFTFSTGDYPE